MYVCAYNIYILLAYICIRTYISYILIAMHICDWIEKTLFLEQVYVHLQELSMHSVSVLCILVCFLEDILPIL